MAINITKALNEIQVRLDDSTQTGTDLNRLISIASRANNSGINALTYRSTGHLPSTADSNYIGFMAYVASDNEFGDSSGRFYYGSNRDSGWIAITTAQDSDEGTIGIPGPPTPTFSHVQGSSYGFLAGGQAPGAADNMIQKYSFTSDGNSVDTGGDLSAPNSSFLGGHASSTHGYTSGGDPFTVIATINKYPLTAGGNATDIGDIISPSPQPTAAGRRYGTGASSTTHGYATAGQYDNNQIDKFSFSVDGNSTDVGDLTEVKQALTNASSADYGYGMGGQPLTNVIQKWPFAADANAVDVGDLTVTVRYASGNSSLTDGYRTGGQAPSLTPNRTESIEKFPFATDTNSADAADLATGAMYNAGSNSTTHGYSTGGYNTAGAIDVIQKFSYSVDENGTDVGNLQYGNYFGAGQAQI